ncbi:V-set and transmembrane domain-containing protein 2-like protein [Tachysurus ichikawai]
MFHVKPALSLHPDAGTRVFVLALTVSPSAALKMGSCTTAHLRFPGATVTLGSCVILSIHGSRREEVGDVCENFECCPSCHARWRSTLDTRRLRRHPKASVELNPTAFRPRSQSEESVRESQLTAEREVVAVSLVAPQEEMSKDATKISVVKVAGSNISHKLRLSSVKPSDEGTYECRVIDFSDSRPRHHRVRAYLQVEGDGSAPAPPHHRGEAESQKHQPTAHHGHKSGRELRKRAADDTNTDCTVSCAL